MTAVVLPALLAAVVIGGIGFMVFVWCDSKRESRRIRGGAR